MPGYPPQAGLFCTLIKIHWRKSITFSEIIQAMVHLKDIPNSNQGLLQVNWSPWCWRIILKFFFRIPSARSLPTEWSASTGLWPFRKTIESTLYGETLHYSFKFTANVQYHVFRMIAIPTMWKGWASTISQFAPASFERSTLFCR